MEQTARTINDLADAFSKGPCPKALYAEALEALVRLAISEHLAEPVIATQADMQRVAEIRAASRSFG